jgi:hypothetical protein
MQPFREVHMSENRGGLWPVIVVLMLLFIQSLVPFFGASGEGPASEPTQIYNPIIITLETNASAEISNTSGGQATFAGSITNTAPLMKVNVTFKVESNGWTASVDPQSLDFQGRANRSFKFIIEVPAGVANGTTGTAKATIIVHGTAPGRAYNDTVSQNIVATALNSEYKTGPDGGTGGPVGVTITTSHNNTGLTPSSLLTPYIPYIAAFAVIGIVIGLVIKFKARKEKRQALEKSKRSI